MMPLHCGASRLDFTIHGGFSPANPAASCPQNNLVNRKVEGYFELDRKGTPEDVRISPDGKVFYLADMMAAGV